MHLLSIPEEGVFIFRPEEVHVRLVLEFEHQIFVDTISLLSYQQNQNVRMTFLGNTISCVPQLLNTLRQFIS